METDLQNRRLPRAAVGLVLVWEQRSYWPISASNIVPLVMTTDVALGRMIQKEAHSQMLAPNGWSYITVWIVAVFLLNSFTLQLVNLTLNHCPPHSHTRRLLQSSFKARLNAPCAAVALLSHMLPQTLSWGAVGHSLPFTRCELNCSPCGLPGLQLKTSTTFPLCAASFQKTTSLWHVWTPRREAFFHLPFCPQAFCKDVQSRLVCPSP